MPPRTGWQVQRGFCMVLAPFPHFCLSLSLSPSHPLSPRILCTPEESSSSQSRVLSFSELVASPAPSHSPPCSQAKTETNTFNGPRSKLWGQPLMGPAGWGKAPVQSLMHSWLEVLGTEEWALSGHGCCMVGAFTDVLAAFILACCSRAIQSYYCGAGGQLQPRVSESPNLQSDLR